MKIALVIFVLLVLEKSSCRNIQAKVDYFEAVTPGSFPYDTSHPTFDPTNTPNEKRLRKRQVHPYYQPPPFPHSYEQANFGQGNIGPDNYWQENDAPYGPSNFNTGHFATLFTGARPYRRGILSGVLSSIGLR